MFGKIGIDEYFDSSSFSSSETKPLWIELLNSRGLFGADVLLRNTFLEFFFFDLEWVSAKTLIWCWIEAGVGPEIELGY